MNRFVFEDRRPIETKREIAPVVPFHTETISGTGRPGKQIRLPEAQKIDNEIEPASANIGDQISHGLNGRQKGAIPHSETVYRQDLIDIRAHLSQRSASFICQERQVCSRVTGLQARKSGKQKDDVTEPHKADCQDSLWIIDARDRSHCPKLIL
jgi:hypothetical protein